MSLIERQINDNYSVLTIKHSSQNPVPCGKYRCMGRVCSEFEKYEDVLIVVEYYSAVATLAHAVSATLNFC